MKVQKSFKILETLEDSEETDFEIQFRITDACNLKCEYCYWNDGPQYKTNDIMICLDRIETFLLKMKFNSVTFYFHGGEPSTHKDLELICKRIKQIPIKTVIEVQTNLIIDVSHIEEIDYFSISLHYNELLRTNKLETFIKNYNKIKKINNLDIMLENVENKEQYYKFILNLYNKKVKNSEMIYSYFGGYSSEHLDFYNKYNKSTGMFLIDGKEYNTNDLFKNGLDCRSCRCKTTKTQMYCNGNGDLFYCATHMTTKSKPFINILKKDIPTFIYKTDIQCRWNNCIDYFVDRYINKDIYE